MIQAKIIADSTNWLGKRITTLILEYPRYIHSEFMTHRVLSKNSASSRAIPSEKIISDVLENRIYPHWTLNKKGMQGDEIPQEYHNLIDEANELWEESLLWNIQTVKELCNLGIHKQNANRLLEPFFTMKVICTGTEWDNFFALRNHPDAQPEIQELARCIKIAMDNSTPQYLEENEWHIPFGDNINLTEEALWWQATEKEIKSTKIKIATARCARISYTPPDLNAINYERDIELYNRLINAEPAHLSPFEHIARVPTKKELTDGIFNSEWVLGQKGWYEHKGYAVSNLKGWIQYRKILENVHK